jgi:hypothetical protein
MALRSLHISIHNVGRISLTSLTPACTLQYHFPPLSPPSSFSATNDLLLSPPPTSPNDVFLLWPLMTLCKGFTSSFSPPDDPVDRRRERSDVWVVDGVTVIVARQGYRFFVGVYCGLAWNSIMMDIDRCMVYGKKGRSCNDAIIYRIRVRHMIPS